MSLFSLDELLFFVYAYTFTIKLIILAFKGLIGLLYLPVLMYFEYNKPRCIGLREIKTGSCYFFEPIGRPISEVHQIFNDTDTSSEMFSPVVVDLFAIAELEDLSSEPNVACCPWATVITVGSNTMCICVYCETDDDSLSEADPSLAIDKDDCLVSNGVDSVVAVSGGTDTVNTVVVGSNTSVGYFVNKPDIVSETPEVYTSSSIDTKSGLPDPGLSGEGDYALGGIGVSLAAACNTSSDNMDFDVPNLELNSPFVLPDVTVVRPYVNYHEVNTTCNISGIVGFGDGFFPLGYDISTSIIGTCVNTNSLFPSVGGACAAVYGKKEILPKKLGVLSSGGRVLKRVPYGKKSRRVSRVVGGVCFPGQPIISIKPGFINSLALKANEDTVESNLYQAEVQAKVQANVQAVVQEVKEDKEVKESKGECSSFGVEVVDDAVECSQFKVEVKDPVVVGELLASSGGIVDKPDKSKKRKNIVENDFSFIPACSSVSETEPTRDATFSNPFGLNSLVLSSSKTFGKDLSEEFKSLKKLVVAPAVKTASYTKLSLDDPFGSSPIDSLYARTLEAKKKIHDDKVPREEKGKRPERLFVPDNKKEERKILKPKGRRN